MSKLGPSVSLFYNERKKRGGLKSKPLTFFPLNSLSNRVSYLEMEVRITGMFIVKANYSVTCYRKRKK